MQLIDILGGSIGEARNGFLPSEVDRILFSGDKGVGENAIIVLFCEFSIKRSIEMYEINELLIGKIPMDPQ